MFRFYPHEKHWWSFNDYRAVLEVMQRFGPKRVLEFGPGSSTLALIEGGATLIHTCEDKEEWAAVYRERLEQRFPSIVSVVRYDYALPLSIPSVDSQQYDLALIDGPHGTEARVPVIEYCIARCTRVLVPLEEVAYGVGPLREPVVALAAQYNLNIEYIDSGPLSGTFALLS